MTTEVQKVQAYLGTYVKPAALTVGLSVAIVTPGLDPPVNPAPLAVIAFPLPSDRASVIVYGPPFAPVTVTFPAPMLDNAAKAVCIADAEAFQAIVVVCPP
jgi:hypothetical protein